MKYYLISFIGKTVNGQGVRISKSSHTSFAQVLFSIYYYYYKPLCFSQSHTPDILRKLFEVHPPLLIPITLIMLFGDWMDGGTTFLCSQYVFRMFIPPQLRHFSSPSIAELMMYPIVRMFLLYFTTLVTD